MQCHWVKLHTPIDRGDWAVGRHPTVTAGDAPDAAPVLLALADSTLTLRLPAETCAAQQSTHRAQHCGCAPSPSLASSTGATDAIRGTATHTSTH